jgi:hypothetical protein
MSGWTTVASASGSTRPKPTGDNTEIVSIYLTVATCGRLCKRFNANLDIPRDG